MTPQDAELQGDINSNLDGQIPPGTIIKKSKTTPQDRDSFITYCLQRLGSGVHNVEISPDQASDAVDDALTLFQEYHYNGTQRTYLKHAITLQDFENRWIPCDESIFNVVSIVLTDAANLSIFDIRYQLRLQDFYNFSNVSMTHYVITMEKLRLIEWLMNPEPHIEFNRFMNRIYVNMDWSTVSVGQFLIFEVYQIVDPDIFTNIWADRWLKNYAVALMHRQWGMNLKKYNGVQTLGGVTLNGQQIYDEAITTIDKLEQELYRDYQPPCRIFIG